jgi:hypothetical protein
MHVHAPAVTAVCVSVATLFPMNTDAQQRAPLSIEAKIPLGKVDGRIDHLALDLDRHGLFVAELGNGLIGPRTTMPLGPP